MANVVSKGLLFQLLNITFLHVKHPFLLLGFPVRCHFCGVIFCLDTSGMVVLRCTGLSAGSPFKDDLR